MINLSKIDNYLPQQAINQLKRLSLLCRVKRILCSVTAHCTLYSVQCTLYAVQCTLYSTLYCVQCTHREYFVGYKLHICIIETRVVCRMPRSCLEHAWTHLTTHPTVDMWLMYPWKWLVMPHYRIWKSFAVYNIHLYTFHNEHCIVYNVTWVDCVMYDVHCTSYIVHYTYSVRRTLYVVYRADNKLQPHPRNAKITRLFQGK